MVGRTLSHYRILEEIRRGGMGVVYRALDVKLEREVAVKVLPPELVADPERKRRFIQEAKAAAKLEHPHIGVVHEIGEEDGLIFIVMELIRGEMLRDSLDKERLSLGRVLELAAEVAEGLARAHDQGIVHRDLKPANIMLTDDGHAKVIDFGLAKLVEPAVAEGSGVETRTRAETDAGTVLGTISYMSPEQARGRTVDHRSDVFSIGITLYEMLTGRVPFEGPTGIDTLQAILNQPVPDLPALGPDVSSDAAFEVEHIVEKCLAKDPSERYQTMKDLVVDLRSARRRLESSSVRKVVPVAAASRSWARSWKAAAATLAVVVLTAALVFLLKARSSPLEPGEAGFKPSVAILYFENTTGDPSLDWLRTGLTDMLVTDLSQSPHVEVLSTDRLYHILSEMSRLDERITSMEVIQEVAERAGVGTVVLGSFQRVGESIRINIRVQEARTGKILTSEKVEGVGESSIFPMVDELTRRIKSDFDVPPAAQADLEQELKDVTTSSVEAYRYYVEGIRLHTQLKEKEAIPLFEKAVEVDPSFAMALAKLAIIHGNLVHPTESEAYAKRALDKVDRLTARERYYIEGMYYARRVRTLGRSIDAYRKAVELYPDHNAARNNLAANYLELGEYEEAVHHYEELRRRNYTFPGAYGGLAEAYGSHGELEKGFAVLDEFVRRNPESGAGFRDLGDFLVSWGKLDEGLEAYGKAESLGWENTHLGRFNVCILREQWEAANALVRNLEVSPDPSMRVAVVIMGVTGHLYQGRSRDALEILEARIPAVPPGRIRAVLRFLSASISLALGEPARALEEARPIEQEGQGSPFHEREGPALTALAQAQLGRWEEAEESFKRLEELAEAVPAKFVVRRVHTLAGQLALARGDTAAAITELRRAEAMLPARGLMSNTPQPHVGVWYPLASAYLEAGDEEQAAVFFERITASATERMWWPVQFVRSFYFLGTIYEKRGEMESARSCFRRFYEYWKDGDVDRERVAEAESKLSLAPRGSDGATGTEGFPHPAR